MGKKSHLFPFLRLVLLLGCISMVLVFLVSLVLLMLLVHAKSFCKKIKSLTGPNKLVLVRMY